MTCTWHAVGIFERERTFAPNRFSTGLKENGRNPIPTRNPLNLNLRARLPTSPTQTDASRLHRAEDEEEHHMTETRRRCVKVPPKTHDLRTRKSCLGYPLAVDFDLQLYLFVWKILGFRFAPLNWSDPIALGLRAGRTCPSDLAVSVGRMLMHPGLC